MSLIYTASSDGDETKLSLKPIGTSRVSNITGPADPVLLSRAASFLVLIRYFFAHIDAIDALLTYYCLNHSVLKGSGYALHCFPFNFWHAVVARREVSL